MSPLARILRLSIIGLMFWAVASVVVWFSGASMLASIPVILMVALIMFIGWALIEILIDSK